MTCTCLIELQDNMAMVIVKCGLCKSAPQLLEACLAAIPELVKWSSDPHFEAEDGGDYSVALRLITAAIEEAGSV